MAQLTKIPSAKNDAHQLPRTTVQCLMVKPDLVPSWGWSRNEGSMVENVLHVELPTGEAQFRAVNRHDGPAYPGFWNPLLPSRDRVIEFVEGLLPSRAQSGRSRKRRS